MNAPPAAPAPGLWDLTAAQDLYNIPAWSEGYFAACENGHLSVCPHPDQSGPDRSGRGIDLYNLAEELRQRGQPLPVLVRFPDILADRIRRLEASFRSAMERHDYRATYQALYPIKVNQQRSVVQALVGHGAGLETGSKAELMMALALAQADTPIVCNGYKDHKHIQLALTGNRLGLSLFLVVETSSELEQILELAQEMQITPRIGVRVRLHSIASGNWQNTGGEKSKFGLHSSELLEAIELLRTTGQLGVLRMLHFHIGSQIPEVRPFQRALHEGARYYAELRRLGAPIDWVDVGGGLGVDYEGTRSGSNCSMNYSLQEYADTVVGSLALICREQKLPPPTVFTECGRMMTAHHAMLITDVIHVEQPPGGAQAMPGKTQNHPLLERLHTLLAELNAQNVDHSCRDANHCRDEAREMFIHGILHLDELAAIEQLHFTLCRHARPLLGNSQNHSQAELVQALEERLVDKYFCNFSLFQTLPDAWAIGQIFPVVPLHRLHESPARRATLHDLTCDADGRINHYVESGGLQSSLALHEPAAGERYLLGIFLLGAYQEVLGDMHNLFGDTASLNVELDGDGHRISEMHRGDSVADLLQYVHLSSETLADDYRRKLRLAQLPPPLERRCLEILTAGLHSYTYLER